MLNTAADEAAFERKAEQHFKGHREIPNQKGGRDFMWNYYRRETRSLKDTYRKRYDLIKWNTRTKEKKLLKAVDA